MPAPKDNARDATAAAADELLKLTNRMTVSHRVMSQHRTDDNCAFIYTWDHLRNAQSVTPFPERRIALFHCYRVAPIRQ
jgi:hypothetical protein